MFFLFCEYFANNYMANTQDDQIIMTTSLMCESDHRSIKSVVPAQKCVCLLLNLPVSLATTNSPFRLSQ